MFVEIALHQISKRPARSLRAFLSNRIIAACHVQHRLGGHGARLGQTKITRVAEVQPTWSPLPRVDGIKALPPLGCIACSTSPCCFVSHSVNTADSGFAFLTVMSVKRSLRGGRLAMLRSLI